MPERRRRRTLRRILLAAGILVLVAVVAFVVWSQIVMRAEPEALARVRADTAITVTESDSAIVLTPADPDGTGLVFVPGAKVEPSAYEATLAPLVDAGTTVVITRPILNLAFFDLRPLDAFTSQAPGVEAWAVGGHSLGGVKACQWGEEPGVKALVHLGSYCANDLSGIDLAVLSVGASEDGLSTPAKIAAAAGELPASARTVQIDGAVHAFFGWYGEQPGDGTPTVSHEESDARLAAALVPFIDGLAG